MYQITVKSFDEQHEAKDVYETNEEHVGGLIDGFIGLLVTIGFQPQSIENNLFQRCENIKFISDLDYDNAG